MGRTLTITDDETNTTASVRIETTDAGPRITRLEFTATGDDGPGLSPDSVRLMEALGLRLPVPGPVGPAPAAAPAPVAAKRPAARKAAPVKGKAKAAAPAPRKRPALPAAPPSPSAGAPKPRASAPAAEPIAPAAVMAVLATPSATVPTEPAAPDPGFLAPSPRAERGAPAPRRPAPARATEPPQRKANRTGPPPSAEQLTAAFRRHNGSLADMAAEFGAATGTVGNWLRRARENGHTITLAPAVTGA